MRRLHLTVAAAVSFVSIVTTATSVLAVSSAATPYGVLRPQDGWKVGTVDTAGAPYCAMVGKFDKQVVVAFARNVDGFGSVALDFKDSFFKAGEEYEVSLKADGIKNRTLVGRASSERSIVVQIGRDDAFYDTLSNNGELVIGMPMLEVTFALRQFSGAHKNLETCSAKLEKPAEAVERNALAPIDREIEKLNSERTRLAAVGAEVAKLEKEVDAKTSSFDELEAQLEAEARAEAARSEETLAKIETEKAGIQTQLADVATIEPAAGEVAEEQPVSGGRKLLASMGAKMKALVPSSSGTSAREIEQTQITVANADRAAEETKQALAEKDPETRAIEGQIAMLEAEKQRETSAQIEAFDRTQANLARETEKLVEARNRQMAALATTPEDKKTKVDLVTSQAKIAAVEETKKESAVDLTRALASTKSDFEARIASLTSERDALKSELASAKSENTRLSGELARQASAVSIRDAGEIAALREQLAAAEKAQQEEIARAATAASELARARSEIAALREESKAELARLATLKDSLATERASLTAMRDKMEKDQLAAAQSTAATTASAGELAKERATLENLRLVLERKQADLDAQAAQQTAEAERLKTTAQSVAAIPTTAPQKLMESERAELSELRARIRAMEAGETISKAAPVTDNAELARLKDENKSLRDKLASFLTSGKPAEVAVTAQPVIEPTPVVEMTSTAPAAPEAPATAAPEAPVAAAPEAPVAIVPLDDSKSKSAQATPAVKPTGIMAKLAVYAQSASTPVAAPEKVAETKPTAIWTEEKVVAAPVEVVQKAQIVEPVAEVATLTADEKSALAATEPAAGAVETVSPTVAAVQPEVKTESVKVEAVEAEPVQAVEEMPAPIVAEPARAPSPVAPAPEKKAEKKKASDEDRAIAHLFGRALGYRAPKMDDANFEMPAVPAEPVETVAAPNPAKAVIEVRQAPTASADTLGAQSSITGDDMNRAAAFLDNVMAFHRPGGENLNAEALPPREQAVAAREVTGLNNIETAAGSTFAPTLAAPVVEQQQPARAPMRREVSGGLIGLEALLERAGISSRQEVASQPGLRQWTSGNYNGLFETVPSSGGDMEGAVRQYLSRYQQDCPQKLEVNVSGIERRQAGEVMRAQAVCTMQGNDYATSFVFLRNQQGLQALLHAGSSTDVSSLGGISTSIASVLDTVDGISTSSQGSVASVPVSYVPEQPRVVTNEIRDSVIERPRRNIEIDAPAAVPPQGHDLPTTVIE